MEQRDVILPAEQTAAVIADSDATDDDEYR